MSTIDWGAILTGVITAVVTAVGGSIWVRFTRGGQSLWTTLGKTQGLRSVFVIAVVALVLAVGALIALVLRSHEVKLEVVAGERTYAVKNAQDNNWAASGSCGPGWILINYYCQIGDEQLSPAGGGTLQNLGVKANGTFHCLWNNVSGNFRAWGQPVCLRVSNK